MNFYYSLGKEDCALEDRISCFEQYISSIVKRIDGAKEVVHLTAKELELMKLYGVLCANRHHYTSEVILDDEAYIYKGNNYLFGTHLIKNQEEAIKVTGHIIDEFERILKLGDNLSTQIDPQIIDPRTIFSVYTIGVHIVILRSDKMDMCISERCAIIENTLDSDHLYTYIPISPHTAICIVKSKYYLSWQHFEYTKYRFGNKYGLGVPDPYLSVIFKGHEDLLFCSYYLVKSNVHVRPAFLVNNRAESVFIKIVKVPSDIILQLNSIFCEDGEKILFCNKEALEKALELKLDCRHIKTSF